MGSLPSLPVSNTALVSLHKRLQVLWLSWLPLDHMRIWDSLPRHTFQPCFYWVLSPPWGSDWIYGSVLGNHQILLLSAPLEYSLPLYPSCLYSPALWEQYFSLRESSPTSPVLYSLGAVLFVIYPEASTCILFGGFWKPNPERWGSCPPSFLPRYSLLLRQRFRIWRRIRKVSLSERQTETERDTWRKRISLLTSKILSHYLASREINTWPLLYWLGHDYFIKV